MTDSEHAAVESLERLGLSNYEARMFVALQKLGTGTAREVHRVADIPRSQVYGAADELEERGLVEIQQSTPKRYRPVSLEAARNRLEERLERERKQAFDYLETVQREKRGEETRDDVWTVRGRESVDDRTVDLAGGATDRILFAAVDLSSVPDDLLDVLRDRAAAGVDVVVVSENPDVRAHFEAASADSILVVEPVRETPTDFMGRVLLCDDATVLLSVLADAALPDVRDETAIWSTDTAMAAVLVQIIRGGIMSVVDPDGLDE
ncbi:Sugar-specific transcriptional regulator TrmB [Halogranum amylolyticum]|uniref:Sugar-specific transcriptional regulator TrmB n=1 Tax=Halogranum amylolyticum TaxID=660520 RepID=A0A1H8SHM5_9EURY|nr:helix-turn-helix domain-containing protein [Halogranum amylolyticum]SEO78250.1 Sugar-specific transcriptional regulator TrmB [Halogranum amylolyticum]